MHDSVTQDFDRISDFNDNGLTPLQRQQDKQPEGNNRAKYAIDNDVADIMTLYPPWSTNTNDRCDNNQVASDRNRKEIQNELYKDTPVKTENNKPYIDNIDAYNRDRALITKCKVVFPGFCRVQTFYQSPCCLHMFFLVFSFRGVRFCFGEYL